MRPAAHRSKCGIRRRHTYSAYKFASLTVDGDAVQVDTDADWVTAVTDAVAAANNMDPPLSACPPNMTAIRAAFAATKTGDNDAAWFRTFAASLAVGDGVAADNRCRQRRYGCHRFA